MGYLCTISFCKMNSTEKLCVQWNDFKENLTISFKELREDKDFADVTLACEDGQQIGVHKTVLASSSPFFMEMLKKHKHPHPVIYMRGIKSKHLANILDFLYRGEANVEQGDLKLFLALAEEFKLKGLITTSHSEPEKNKKPQPNQKVPVKKEYSPKPRNENEEPFMSQKFETPNTDVLHSNTVALTNTMISVEVHDVDYLDNQIKSMITKTKRWAGPGKGFLVSCNVCGKEGSYRQMPNHVESNHITGVSHSCNICGKTSRTRDGLRKHSDRDHGRPDHIVMRERNGLF